jgi:hypothetical protein
MTVRDDRKKNDPEISDSFLVQQALAVIKRRNSNGNVTGYIKTRR